MRAYTIKRKGKTTLDLKKKITFSDGDIVYVGYIFFRKKDAKKYLGTFSYPEYYEAIGLTINKSDKDNRKKTK
jgi:hypothetical protein